MRFALLIFALAVAQTSWAKCTGGPLEVWPASGARVPLNPVWVVTAGRAYDINWEDMELVSGRQRVSLTVVAHAGYQQTQFVLAPSRPLTAGKTYRLSKPINNIRWKWVVAEASSAQPVLEGQLSVRVGVREEFGCGPAVDVRLHGAQPSTGSRLEITLESGGSKATQYVALDAQGSASLGHDMCGGEFELTGGRRYEGTVAAIDIAGQRSPAQTFSFVAP